MDVPADTAGLALSAIILIAPRPLRRGAEANLQGVPPARRIYALTHDELEALRRLQEGWPAPGPDDPAWSYLLELGLVWLDTATLPATLGLTSAGRGYATDR